MRKTTIASKRSSRLLAERFDLSVASCEERRDAEATPVGEAPMKPNRRLTDRRLVEDIPSNAEAHLVREGNATDPGSSLSHGWTIRMAADRSPRYVGQTAINWQGRGIVSWPRFPGLRGLTFVVWICRQGL